MQVESLVPRMLLVVCGVGGGIPGAVHVGSLMCRGRRLRRSGAPWASTLPFPGDINRNPCRMCATLGPVPVWCMTWVSFPWRWVRCSSNNGYIPLYGSVRCLDSLTYPFLLSFLCFIQCASCRPSLESGFLRRGVFTARERGAMICTLMLGWAIMEAPMRNLPRSMELVQSP